MSINSKTAWLLIALNCIYLIALQTTYDISISTAYGDEGFMNNFDLHRGVIAYAVFIIVLGLSVFLSRSEFILAVNNAILAFILVPNLVLFQYMHMPLAIITGIVLLILLTLLIGQWLKIPAIPALKKAQRIPFLVILSCVFFLPFLFTFGTHLNLDLLLLQDIYETRANSEETQNVFTAYFYSWLGNWIFPVLFVISLWKKNISLSMFSVMGQLYLFLTSGHKITYLVLFLIIIFSFGRDYKKKSLLLTGGLIALIMLSQVSLFFFQSRLIESLFIRRFLFIPSILNIYYYDYFQQNHLYLSHSIFSWLFKYPLNDTPQAVIGKEYFYEGMSANNGIISDGYMNFGFTGIVVNVVVTSLIFGYFNKLNISHRFFSIFIILIITLNSGALLTALLTHGILLFMILATFTLKNTRSEKLV